MGDTKSEISKAVGTAAAKMKGPFDYEDTSKCLDKIAAESRDCFDPVAKEHREKEDKH